MVEPSAQKSMNASAGLPAALKDFELKETVVYANGGSSSFYERTLRTPNGTFNSTALIIDDDIWCTIEGQPIFDYSKITSKQNEYVVRNNRVYRFIREDINLAVRFLESVNDSVDEGISQKQNDDGATFPSTVSEIADAGEVVGDLDATDALLVRRAYDRTDLAGVSPLEMAFEGHFANVYGDDSVRYLQKEYAVADIDGRTWFLDYVVQTRRGFLGVEENGIRYHHPQIIGKERYRKQLMKQNSCQRANIKLYRFSTEDCRFEERLEDDIKSYFGPSTEDFIDAGMVADRAVQLYEHQEGTLDEMARRREQGIKCFLAVFPTASGKSRIVEEDLARFAPTCERFKALIVAPNTPIVDDWKVRLRSSLPAYADDILVCTYSSINRHYTEYAPDYFSYIVIDEAHHAVAPALKRTIQYFDPQFLVGLTATDKRPDKKALEAVFGSYRVGLSLEEAMERGIVARANVFRVETNVDLSRVRVNGKDYVNADLEKTLRVTSRNELIVDVVRTYFSDGEAGRRQGVAFCVNVRHTEEMARLLNEAGIPARALNRSTGDVERTMEEFRSGAVRFLCSCQMISEGWDYPELGILVMARPTLSRVLYLQQLGRGLRRTPTKGNVFVVDVVDDYAAAAVPCSMHTIFSNPHYVPFGDVLRRDYQPGDWVVVDGIRERVERIVEVDAVSFAEKYEGYLSVEQVARDFFVNTGTLNEWIRRGRVTPTVTFPFGSRRIALFSPEDVTATRERLGIPVHNDQTIREDFLAFLAERDYAMSYKMPFVLSFLTRMDPATGDARVDDVLDGYVAFYRDRLARGLVVDRAGCPYDERFLADRKLVLRSMLDNPFEKFERKRFMYRSRDLGLISMNHALHARLSAEDLRAVERQMREDLAAYYTRLEG